MRYILSQSGRIEGTFRTIETHVVPFFITQAQPGLYDLEHFYKLMQVTWNESNYSFKTL